MSAPLEYIIVQFADNDFSGEIVPELAALVDAGLVRIVDLVFVAEGDDGSAVALEVDEHDHLKAFVDLEGTVGGAIGPDDIEHAAESIGAGSSVLLLVWENLWAQRLAEALRRAGGELVEGAIIPNELADELKTVLAEADAS